MTEPTLLPDSDLVPDTTDPEPAESPKTDPVPDDAPEGATPTVPEVVIEADTVIVNETAGEDDGSTPPHDQEDDT